METIDLKKVAAHKIKLAAARMKHAVILKNSADGRILYYWKKYLFIFDDKATTLTEEQVTEKLTAYPDMPVTMWHFHDQGDVAPKPLQGREDLVKREYISLDDIKAYILAQSGVEITDDQLGENFTKLLQASTAPMTKGQKDTIRQIRSMAEGRKRNYSFKPVIHENNDRKRRGCMAGRNTPG